MRIHPTGSIVVFSVSTIILTITSFFSHSAFAQGFYAGVVQTQHLFSVNKEIQPDLVSVGTYAKEPQTGAKVGYKTESHKFWRIFNFYTDFTYLQTAFDTQTFDRKSLDVDGNTVTTTYTMNAGYTAQASGVSVTPVIMVTTNSAPESFFFYGLGVGIGFVQAKGSIYLTSLDDRLTGKIDSGEIVPGSISPCYDAVTIKAIFATCEKHDFNVSGVSSSLGFTLGYQGAGWAFIISSQGPILDRNEYQYQLTEQQFYLIYQF